MMCSHHLIPVSYTHLDVYKRQENQRLHQKVVTPSPASRPRDPIYASISRESHFNSTGRCCQDLKESPRFQASYISGSSNQKDSLAVPDKCGRGNLGPFLLQKTWPHTSHDQQKTTSRGMVATYQPSRHKQEMHVAYSTRHGWMYSSSGHSQRRVELKIIIGIPSHTTDHIIVLGSERWAVMRMMKGGIRNYYKITLFRKPGQGLKSTTRAAVSNHFMPTGIYTCCLLYTS